MAAHTALQKSAETLGNSPTADDVTNLAQAAALAQLLGVSELGGNSTGPAVINLDEDAERWDDLINDLRDEYGQALAARVDLIGSAYMTCESQRSVLIGLMHGRAFGAGEFLDHDAVRTTVNAVITHAPEPRR